MESEECASPSGDPKVLFKLKKPCNNCPFRREGAIELRAGRLERIKAQISADDRATFLCHKTLEQADGASMCAGASAYLLAVGRPNIAMRLGAFTGHLDLEAMCEHIATVSVESSDGG